MTIKFSPQVYSLAEDEGFVNVTLQLVGETTELLYVLINTDNMGSTGKNACLRSACKHIFTSLNLECMLTFCEDESDYNLMDEEAYFYPGVIEVNVTLAIIDDDIFEANESVELHLTVPQTLQDVILVISDTAVVTINDNDGIVLVLLNVPVLLLD